MKSWLGVKAAIQRMRLNRSRSALAAEDSSFSREPSAPEELPPPTLAAVMTIFPVSPKARATAEGKTPPGPA
jgi:hypothetical protein